MAKIIIAWLALYSDVNGSKNICMKEETFNVYAFDWNLSNVCSVSAKFESLFTISGFLKHCDKNHLLG